MHLHVHLEPVCTESPIDALTQLLTDFELCGIEVQFEPSRTAPTARTKDPPCMGAFDDKVHTAVLPRNHHDNVGVVARSSPRARSSDSADPGERRHCRYRADGSPPRFAALPDRRRTPTSSRSKRSRLHAPTTMI